MPRDKLQEQVTFWWHDHDWSFVLDQHAWLEFYSASPLKQQSAGRHVALFKQIILILSPTILALIPYAVCIAEKQPVPIL